MKLSHSLPPNYGEIVKFVRPNPRTLFCYGDTIYAPGVETISKEIHAHELVHSKRQGGDPEEWWHRYLRDISFRVQEEVLAHMAEYTEHLSGSPNRHERRGYLKFVVRRLVGPLYGKILTPASAKQAVLTGTLPKRVMEDLFDA